MLGDQLAEHAFTLSRAICPGGVEEIAAKFNGAVKRAHRFAIVRADPPRHPHMPWLISEIGQPNRPITLVFMFSALR